MRQAGRYMPEYRRIREQHSFLELCRNPQLCSEIMCTAVERLGVDAAIIFSDLLPILEPMGMDLEFAQGEGPLIHNPVRESADVDRVDRAGKRRRAPFRDGSRAANAGRPAGHIPLIGFAGAPFTLASYAIEGGASRNYLHTKTLMYRDRGAWDALMERLARAVIVYLNAQIAAGAQAVQLFDSWVGCLGPDDYRQLRAAVRAASHRRHHARRAGDQLRHRQSAAPAAAGRRRRAAVIGVDWRVRLDDAWQMIGHDRAIQGNLDPLVLLGRHGRTPPPRRRHPATKPPAAPATSSTSATACCRKRRVDNARALVDIVHEQFGDVVISDHVERGTSELKAAASCRGLS